MKQIIIFIQENSDYYKNRLYFKLINKIKVIDLISEIDKLWIIEHKSVNCFFLLLIKINMKMIKIF